MRTQATVLAVTLLIGGAVGAASPVDALVDEGSKKLQAGDAAGAVAVFDRAVKAAPRDPRPLYLRAAAYKALGDLAAAEKGWRAALALDPRLAEVHNELGLLYSERGRRPEAIAELKAAVAAKPDLAEGWHNLGQEQLAAHSCADAVAALARGAQLAGDADGYIDLSAAQRACKQLEPATASARQAVKLDGKSAAAHLSLGLSLDDLGRPDEAVAELKTAIKLQEKNALAWWSLGLLELKRGHGKPALEALDRAYQLSPTPARATDLGRAARDTGDLARAKTLFEEALKKNPRYSPARFFLAQVLAKEGRCAEVTRTLAALPPKEAQSPAAQKLRTDCKPR
jgi:tetratricopeptide (TPR) repeat protein